VAHGKSFYVELVDQGFVPGDFGRRVGSPSECGIDYPVFWHACGIVTPVKRQILLFVSDSVSKVGVAPTNGSVNLLAIRVEQKFVVIKTMASFRRIGTKHPISIQLARAYFRQVTVPDHIGLLGKRDAKGLAFSGDVEEAKLHLLRVLRVKREVDALAIPV
jgi:hypothetical protein